MNDYFDNERVIIIIVGFILIFFAVIFGAHSRELYPGQYSQVSPEIQKWFSNQKSPKTGAFCCSQADGEQVEEDIRGDQYWVRSDQTREYLKSIATSRNLHLPAGIDADGWIPVPNDVVIKEPNKAGHPVAWWYWENGKLMIRCFVPGALF